MAEVRRQRTEGCREIEVVVGDQESPVKFAALLFFEKFNRASRGRGSGSDVYGSVCPRAYFENVFTDGAVSHFKC